LTIGATRAGMILGTAAYMSPEQAAGRPVDRRSDIWSFGAVLYEMLAGKGAFPGESVTETLANVLKAEPDWNALPAGTPASIRNLVRRCLKKDCKQRLQAIGEARIVIEEAVSGASQEGEPVTPQRLNRALAAATAVLVLALMMLGVLLWRATRPVDRSLVRLTVDLGPDAVAGRGITAILSPDGTRLAYFSKGSDGKRLLTTRLLEQPKGTVLAGTEDAEWPFFSPNGEWIGFFAAGKMKRISVQGGAPVILCNATRPFGASWGTDGNIILAIGRANSRNSPFAGIVAKTREFASAGPLAKIASVRSSTQIARR